MARVGNPLISGSFRVGLDRVGYGSVRQCVAGRGTDALIHQGVARCGGAWHGPGGVGSAWRV